MLKFSYYQFIKEAAMQKLAFRVPGRMRGNGGRGVAKLMKIAPTAGGTGLTIVGARRKGVLEGATDDVRAYGRLGKRLAKKLLAAVLQYAALTGTNVNAVFKQLKDMLGSAADKAKGAVDAAGSKAKATAEAGKDALVGAYEKAKPAVQEAGQKALAWLGGHRLGLRDIGLGALLGDALLDED